MNKFNIEKSLPFSFSNTTLLTMLGLLLIAMLSMSHAHSAWFERLIPKGETYTVEAVDRDVAFVIDDFIYDARQFCYMAVGDRVVFFEGRYGIDYRATVYNLDANERCELLLRDRVEG
ncbi:hypothetical protein [uncultured Psychrobacter sp.]|uniref:hypothetical protein n=1 Tax=uncultured Psychrobacter sp. TaxID=259303 RepID=UPI00345AC1F1